MRYGFVIDQHRCIGCHACTVACKEENQVPLGVFRTWVKYVERGTFPHTRRYFAVLRCNHCDSAPCVTICPTVALYRRPDGIVDFDGARCIGCKACMQACPYDALYIDPNTGTAAKCHYCAHRVEVGLEPACVVVCPEQAIVAGDLDDPESPIARLVSRAPMQVRKAEQGTRPKVFYLGADASVLTPELQSTTDRYLWAERPEGECDLVRMTAAVAADAGDGALSRPVYDVPHAPRPWGRKVAAYLFTKSIAAGPLLIAGVAVLGGGPPSVALLGIGAPVLALLFLLATAAFLVLDLKRPERFHYIFVRSNHRSWLTWGAWILVAYGGVAALWLGSALLGRGEIVPFLALPALVLAAASAGYSAFLFAQAEGRDFWQSALLFPQLLLAAVVAGSASLLVVGFVVGADLGELWTLSMVMAVALLLHGLAVIAELLVPHANRDAARAAALITRGEWKTPFWGGVIAAGTALPVVLIWPTPYSAALGGALALLGLWIYEDLWVKAGQSVPLS